MVSTFCDYTLRMETNHAWPLLIIKLVYKCWWCLPFSGALVVNVTY